MLTTPRIRLALFAAFVAVVYLANLAIERHGTFELPLGLEATWGALFAGLAFGIRDALHETAGRRWVLAAIAAGAGLTWWLSAGLTLPGGLVSLAAASGLAFTVSELADYGIYAPIRERRWVAAVVASNVAGGIVDSGLFLWLAFGALEGGMLAGQILVKAAMIAPALALVGALRHRQEICWACDGATDEERHTCRLAASAT